MPSKVLGAVSYPFPNFNGAQSQISMVQSYLIRWFLSSLCRWVECSLHFVNFYSAILVVWHNMILLAWDSYQIRKLARAHAPGMPESFPRHRGLAIPTCITARASRTCRGACRDRYLAVFFEVGGGEIVPGIPGTCTTRNICVSGKRSMHDVVPIWNININITKAFLVTFTLYENQCRT